MNENITSYLNEYIQNPNPQYAVLISGQWGCGKTFYIKKWLSSLTTGNDDSPIITRKPIYVSLYGLHNTGAINSAIEREIRPWLYSKGMNIAKKVVKALGKATIRYDFDIDGNKDNAQSEQLSYTLDVMSLFGDDEENIKGERILVLDDLERCKIDIEELLGYINFFVEHSKCKVIVVGDISKLVDSNNTFKRHKEKLFGREFSIIPDIDSAISSFIKTIGSNNSNLLEDNKKLIKDIIILSKKQNLRVVRQAIYDYNQCINKIANYSKKEKYSYVAQTLLCNFIITYIEYKTGNEVYENWKKRHLLADIKNDKAFDFTRDYKALQYDIVIFDDNLIECIMNYMLKGVFDGSYLIGLLKDENDKQPWQILSNYWLLDNSTFEKAYNESLTSYRNSKIETIGEVISTAICFLMIDVENIKIVDKKEVSCILQNNIISFLDKIDEPRNLFAVLNEILTQLNRYSEYEFNSLLKEICKQIQDYYSKRITNSKNKLTLFFETMSDDTVHQLYSLLLDSLPDRSRSYYMGAILKDVDTKKCTNSILKLSNASRDNLLGNLEYHYRHEVLGPSNALESIQNYKDDIIPLETISKQLLNKVAQYKLIDAYSIKRIIQFLQDTAKQMEELMKKKKKNEIVQSVTAQNKGDVIVQS